jgi:hypothetical protein
MSRGVRKSIIQERLRLDPARKGSIESVAATQKVVNEMGPMIERWL